MMKQCQALVLQTSKNRSPLAALIFQIQRFDIVHSWAIRHAMLMPRQQRNAALLPQQTRLLALSASLLIA